MHMVSYRDSLPQIVIAACKGKKKKSQRAKVASWAEEGKMGKEAEAGQLHISSGVPRRIRARLPRETCPPCPRGPRPRVGEVSWFILEARIFPKYELGFLESPLLSIFYQSASGDAMRLFPQLCCLSSQSSKQLKQGPLGSSAKTSKCNVHKTGIQYGLVKGV